jgi:hypothetical protein
MKSDEVIAETLLREMGSLLLFDNISLRFELHPGTRCPSSGLNVPFTDPFSSFDLFLEAVKPCPRQSLSIELVSGLRGILDS